MNITPDFVNGIEFKKFKRTWGDCSMEILVTLGIKCQLSKSSTIVFNDTEDIDLMFDVGEFDGEKLLKDLVRFNLATIVGENEYRIDYFEETNRQLLSNWANGERKRCKADDYQKRRNIANSYISKKSVRQAIFARDKHRCVCCGSTEDLTIDHIIPVSKGGESDFDNLQTLCLSCNANKGDKILVDPTDVNSSEVNLSQVNSSQDKSTQQKTRQDNTSQVNSSQWYASQSTSNAGQSRSNAIGGCFTNASDVNKDWTGFNIPDEDDLDEPPF